MTVPSSATHTEAVRSALVASGLRVGVGHAPTGTSPKPTLAQTPYVVLWPGGLGVLDGPVNDSHADASPTFHVISVAYDVAGAEWAVDKATVALLGTPITVAGRAQLHPVELEASQPARRDDDLGDPPLFYATAIFRMSTTPA